MAIETVTTNQKTKDQLLKLKRATGIQNWNTLCRWAICSSLAIPTPPEEHTTSGETAIEMTWKTFTGEHPDIYNALIVKRCVDDDIEPTKENLVKHFKLHLARGIDILLKDAKRDKNYNLLKYSKS